MPVRTFFALEIDQATRDALLEVSRRADTGGAKIKWVERDNLHVTLNFLGSVADEIIPRVCDVGAAVAGEVEPFDFELRGAVCVPPRGRQVRMIWAAVADPTRRLEALYEKLALGLEPLGFDRDKRAFKPHITLARIKAVADAEALRNSVGQWGQTNFGGQHAGELVAFSSKLMPTGPAYTPIARAPLGG
ncbi:MAG: RNA 2',3'-cyclic phosphodiesterase [Planctomycetota bacterium]|jgi:2'-5' RNA ligase